METLLNHPWEWGFLVAIVLALALECGRSVAVHSSIHDDASRKDQIVTIRDGLFVLLSLLLGFTLALAAPRYVERRSLLVEEAVSIGTTYLRASILPQPYCDRSQRLLREYVTARLHLDNAGSNPARYAEATNRWKKIQEELWSEAAAASQTDRSAIAAVYVSALNKTIDLHELRVAALENRIPKPVWLLIIAVCVIALFSRGLTLTSRFWLTLILVPITVAVVVALIADLDTPSSGLIQLDQRTMLRLKMDLNAASQVELPDKLAP